MSAAEKKTWDTFFSNFAEAYVEPFQRGGPSNKQCIQFGIFHSIWNQRERFTNSEVPNKKRIPAAYIAENVRRYLGKDIRNESVEDTLYKEGFYYVAMGEGEAITFAQITRLNKTKRANEWAAQVKVYQAANGWDGDVHAAPASWHDDSGTGNPTLKYVRNAIVRKITEQGKSRYILVEWTNRK